MPISKATADAARKALLGGGAVPELPSTKKSSSTSSESLDLASPLKALGNRGVGGSTTAPRTSALSKLPGLAGKAATAGQLVMTGAGALGSVLSNGSGAQGVVQALNPLSKSPTTNAAGNLADVVKPDVGGAMQKLSTDAQANQMAAVGSDTGKWAKVQQQTLTHNNNEDALGAMKDSAGSTKTDIAMRNTATKLQNADSYAKMVTSFVRKTGKTADEIAQGNN